MYCSIRSLSNLFGSISIYFLYISNLVHLRKYYLGTFSLGPKLWIIGKKSMLGGFFS